MKKFTEVRKEIAWAVVALVCFGLGLLLPYVEGRRNDWMVIPLPFPAGALPIFFLLTACVVLASNWIRSISARRQVVLKGLLFSIGLLCLVADFRVPHAVFFLRGFSQYVRTIMTADEWRSIARFAQEHLKPGTTFHAPLKLIPANETEAAQQRELWPAIKAATPIGRLHPVLTMFLDSDKTVIEWGGALVGHRGVIVFTHQGGQLPPGVFRAQYVTDDIATYITAD